MTNEELEKLIDDYAYNFCEGDDTEAEHNYNKKLLKSFLKEIGYDI